jgi:phosphate:Na+ symporter
MADVVRGMLADVEMVIKTGNIDIIDDISNRDDIVDYLDREIKKFLSEHSQFDTGPDSGKRNVEFISVINFLEIAGDIIDKGISEQLSNKILNKYSFSEEGEQEILMYHGKIVEMFDESLVSKKVLGNLEKELKNAHIRRLNKGMKESLETSSIHLDILSSMRRIVSVCAGIAHCVVDFEE